jgi:hypothetical protein
MCSSQMLSSPQLILNETTLFYYDISSARVSKNKYGLITNWAAQVRVSNMYGLITTTNWLRSPKQSPPN